jgi:hypothetical protein
MCTNLLSKGREEHCGGMPTSHGCERAYTGQLSFTPKRMLLTHSPAHTRKCLLCSVCFSKVADNVCPFYSVTEPKMKILLLQASGGMQTLRLLSIKQCKVVRKLMCQMRIPLTDSLGLCITAPPTVRGEGGQLQWMKHKQMFECKCNKCLIRV